MEGSMRPRPDFAGNSKKRREKKFSAGAEEVWWVLLTPISGLSARCVPRLTV